MTEDISPRRRHPAGDSSEPAVGPGDAGAPPPEAATVAAGDIARLAGVGKAAVSNWRRRFDDFPDAVGGSAASPLYALADVENWLRRHGKNFEVPLREQLWPRVRGAADDLRLGAFVASLGAFLVFHQRAGHTWRPTDEVGLLDAVLADAPELSETVRALWQGPQEDVLRTLVELVESEGHVAAFDFLYERHRDAHARRAVYTSPELAELMVRVAGIDGGTVLDPSCGTGTLLLTAYDCGASEILGQEPDDVVATLARIRLLLRGAAPDIVVGDALRADAHGDRRADAVVVNPPFNERSWGYDELVGDLRWEYGQPPRGESELAWVQHCLAHVDSAGIVVAAMPGAVADRRSGRRIRGNLLRAGVLRAVISSAELGMSADGTATEPDLWVFRKGTESTTPSHVLMVGRSQDAEQAWQAFAEDPAADLPESCRAVRIIDLLDDVVDLTPTRWLPVEPDTAVAASFTPVVAELRAALGRLTDALPDLDVHSDTAERAMTTVGELVRSGLITMFQAPTRMPTDTGSLPVLTLDDLNRGTVPSGHCEQTGDTVLIQPGDVIVPMIPREPLVRLAVEAGAALGPRLLLFRANQDRIVPGFLAAHLRFAANTVGGRAGTTGSRPEVRRTPIPRISLQEQQQYGKAFDRMTAFEDALRQTARLGESLVRRGFTGLADGTLRSAR
ncbi:N-6 DNA methylase [Actinoalloteichus sp. GBA129-24]|uniref:N-6 DNA methylase n=1 Tax=Actinoalloteichus sp. GBA129-24 TaxID=1612551 RepID=UPI000950AA3C|nr:N-6 DNA methylase [Actinoalloteichus sp. GBA129-24]APU22199.1 N-6 DNA Methylase [Actinoalloteichus sp. GBA129-24]